MTYHMLKVKNVEFSLLNNEVYLKTLLLKTAQIIGATILNVYTHKFEPQGVSVILTIAESHISVHSFPCEKIGQFEIATCSQRMNTQQGIDFIKHSLGIIMNIQCEEFIKVI